MDTNFLSLLMVLAASFWASAKFLVPAVVAAMTKLNVGREYTLVIGWIICFFSPFALVKLIF